MTGFVRSTVSPSSSNIRRSTPWVEGCCGPMLMIMVSSSVRSTSMSEGSMATPSGSRSTAPTSRRSSPASVAERELSSWPPSEVSTIRPVAVPSGAGLKKSSPDTGGPCTVSGWGEGACASGSPWSSGGADRHPTDAVVLAQGMALPILRQQDAGHVGVPGEDDAEQVVGLALHGLHSGVQLEEGGSHRVRFGNLQSDPHQLDLTQRQQIDHDLEPLGCHPFGQPPARVGQVVDAAEIGAHLEPAVAVGTHHLDVLC